MMYKFTARIYKVGINPCVDVPDRITSALVTRKGYISVKGTINQFAFQQTLCPVKDKEYLLYVNRLILQGGVVVVGDHAKFEIEQDDRPKTDIEIPDFLVRELNKHKLTGVFQKLTPSHQKEISKYLGYLKTDEARNRNLEKLMERLKEGKSMWR